MFKWFTRSKRVLTPPPGPMGARAYGILFRGTDEAQIHADVETYRQAYGLRPINVVVKPVHV